MIAQTPGLGGKIYDEKQVPVINGTNAIIPKGTVCRFYGELAADAAAPTGQASWLAAFQTYGQAYRNIFVTPIAVVGTGAAALGRYPTLVVLEQDLAAAAAGVEGGKGTAKLVSDDVQILQTATAIQDQAPITHDNAGSCLQVAADDARVIGYAKVPTAGTMAPGASTSAAVQLVSCRFDGRPVGGIVQNAV